MGQLNLIRCTQAIVGNGNGCLGQLNAHKTRPRPRPSRLAVPFGKNGTRAFPQPVCAECLDSILSNTCSHELPRCKNQFDELMDDIRYYHDIPTPPPGGADQIFRRILYAWFTTGDLNEDQVKELYHMLYRNTQNDEEVDEILADRLHDKLHKEDIEWNRSINLAIEIGQVLGEKAVRDERLNMRRARWALRDGTDEEYAQIRPGLSSEQLDWERESVRGVVCRYSCPSAPPQKKQRVSK